MPKNAGAVVQQCGVGLVRVRRDAAADGGTRLAFAAPPLKRTGPLDETLLARIARALQVERSAIRAHQWVDNGPGWVAVMLGSAAEVLALEPDMTGMADVELGVVGPHPQGHDAQFEVRAFIPSAGVYEDPVTGSLNASIAQWLIGSGLAPERYVAAQGTAMGRAGRVHLARDGDDIWVGGDVAPCIDGTVRL